MRFPNHHHQTTREEQATADLGVLQTRLPQQQEQQYPSQRGGILYSFVRRASLFQHDLREKKTLEKLKRRGRTAY